MDNEKMGRFLAGLRKSKQMTQKDLADRLRITDKAVSKWERADDGSPNIDNSIDSALQYADRAVKSNSQYSPGLRSCR